MTNNDIRIKITGTLNPGASIGEINTAIRGIEKRIQKLKLKVDIDQSALKALDSIAKQLNKVSNTNSHNHKHFSNEMLQTSKQQKKSLNEISDDYGKVIRQVEKYNKAQKKVAETIKLSADENNIKTRTVKLDSKGNVRKYEDTYDVGKEAKLNQQLVQGKEKLRQQIVKLGETGNVTTKQLQGVQQALTSSNDLSSLEKAKQSYIELADKAKLAEQMARGRESGSIKTAQNETKLNQVQTNAINRNTESVITQQQKLKGILGQLSKDGKITESSFKRINSAIDTSKNIDQLKKLEGALGRVSTRDATKNDLSLFQKQVSLNAQNLTRTHGGYVDNTAMQNYLKSVNELTVRTPNLSTQMKNLNMQFREISMSAKSAAGATEHAGMSFGEMFSTAAQKFPIWMLASTAFFLPIRGAQQLIDTLYILDEKLVSIDKVLDNANLSSVFENAAESAGKYGQKISDTLESLGEISKLGFNQNDAEALNNNAMLLSTVGEFESNADAANYLVAIMRQYKLSVEETTKVVDALNNVSNKTGADTVGLAQALSKSSSAAANAGTSFHELMGMASNTAEVLKISGNETGNFYKALFTRYLRSDTQSVLESVGIQTKDMNGELRSATDVLQDLGKAWGTYNSQTKNDISTSLGGAWHVNKVSSLIENQAKVLKNTSYSMDSYMSATNELSTYQKGLQYQTNQMVASFENLAYAIGESGLKDGLISLINSVTYMTQGFTVLTESTNGWNIKLPILIGLSYGLVKSFNAIKVAILGIRSAFGIFSIGILAVEGLASAFSKMNSSSQMNFESLSETAKKTSENTQQLEYLIAKYNELEPVANKNKESQQELQDVLNQIQTLAPNLIDSTGKYGDALSLNKGKADQYIESLKQMTKEQIAQAVAANSIEISNVNVDIDKENQKLKELDDATKKSLDKRAEYQKKYNVSGIVDAETDFRKRLAELTKKGIEAQNNGNLDLASQISQESDKIFYEYENYTNIMKDNSGELKEYADKVGKIQELESKKTGIEERGQALKQLTEETNKSTLSNNENSDSLSNVKEGTYEATEGIDSETAAIELNTQKKYENMSVSEMTVGAKQDDINKTLEMVEVYRMLSNQEVLSESQKYALANATSYLANQYPNLIDGHALNVDAMLEEAESNNILIKAVEASANGQLTAQESVTLASGLNTKARIDNIKTEIDSLATLLDAYGELGEASKDEIMAKVNAGLLPADVGIKIIQAQSGIEQRKAELDSLSASLEGVTLQLAEIPSVQAEYNSSTEDSIYVTDKFNQAIEENNAQIAKQNSIQSKYPTWSQHYRDSLQKEIDLLKEKKGLTEDQADSLEKQIKSGNIESVGNTSSSNSSGKSSASKTALSGSDNASKIWNFFTSKGFSDSVVAGIMGNLQLESGLNSSAVNPTSGAYGIAQWLGGRKTALDNYAKSLGTNINDLSTQLSFLWKELNSTEKNTLNYLNSNQNASASTIAAMFDKLFERSEGTTVGARQDYANQFYNKYKSNGSVSNISGSSSDTNSVDSNVKTIDEATSELNRLRSEISGMDAEIDALEAEIVNSYVENYSRKNEKLNEKINRSKTRQEKYSDTGKNYQNEIDLQTRATDDQISNNNDTIEFFEKLIKKGGLSAKTVEALKDQLQDLKGYGLELDNNKKDLSFEKVQSEMKAYEESIDNVDEAIKKSERNQAKYGSTSKNQIREHQNEIKLRKKKISELKKEREEAEKSLKNDKLKPNQRKELQEKVEDLTNSIEDETVAIKDENAALIQINIKKYEDKIDNLDYRLQMSQQRQNLYKEGSKEWVNELKIQAKLNKMKQEELDKEREHIRLQLLSADIDAKERENLQEQLEDLDVASLQVENDMKTANESIADNYIEAMKNAYEIERDIKLKMLDEESEKLDEIYQKKIREIDDKESQDDYIKDLANKQKEAQELQSKINKLAMDDSTWAKKEKEALEKELADKTLEINEFVHDRNLELRKQSLEDETQTKQDALNEERESINKHYDEILNDERYFSQMRQDILNGDIEKYKIKLEEITANITKNTEIIGNSIVNNIVDTVKEATDALGAISTATETTADTTKDKSDTKKTDTKKVTVDYSKDDSKSYKGKGVVRVKSPEGKYMDVSTYKLESLVGQGYKITKYHNGGVVGEEPNNRLAELANKLFNVQPNEQIIKSLKGELQIPPKNIPNIFTNIGNLISSILPNQVAPQLTGGTIVNMNINIDKLEGGEVGANQLFKVLNNKLKGKGLV